MSKATIVNINKFNKENRTPAQGPEAGHKVAFVALAYAAMVQEERYGDAGRLRMYLLSSTDEIIDLPDDLASIVDNVNVWETLSYE